MSTLAAPSRDVHSRLEMFLSRLENVRQTGQDRYRANCPNGHRSQGTLSVSISQRDGESILFHCFAGCDVESVLSAVGLAFRDLYPPRTEDHRYRSERRPFPATDILKTLAHEALVVAIAAEDLHKGEKLSDEDRERLLQAANRIQEGVNYVR